METFTAVGKLLVEVRLTIRTNAESALKAVAEIMVVSMEVLMEAIAVGVWMVETVAEVRLLWVSMSKGLLIVSIDVTQMYFRNLTGLDQSTAPCSIRAKLSQRLFPTWHVGAICIWPMLYGTG
jgi:hypothetical protein